MKLLRDLRNRVKILLAEKDMTQQELAYKLGFSTRSVSEFISGKSKNINRKLLIAIINEFDLDSMDELFKIVEK